ncbi:MAG: TIGR04086 family membrane protein [Oscillospiraceae bacterium]
MPNENQSNNSISKFGYFKIIMFSSIIGLIVIYFGFMISHIIMKTAGIPLRAVEPIVIVIGVLGAFVSGYLASSILKKNGMFAGAVCGVVIFIIMTISNLAVGNKISMLILIKFIAIILAAIIGGIMGVNKRKKHK